MAGVRYRHDFNGYDGTSWQIDIYDNNYTGSVNTFECASGGFSLARNAQNKNRTSPIIGSELTVFALSQNTAFDNLLNQMLTADEDRFFCLLYKDSSLWWAGVLLLDLLDEQDKYYPRQVNIRFTDGIARLKNIDYNDNGARYTGTATIIEHIWNCLNKIPTAQFWTGSDIMLKTNCVYFDTQMSYSGSNDPLPLIRLSHESFYTKDDKGEYIFKSTYDILQNLASVFYSRVWLGDGSFNFMQVESFRNTTFKAFEYEKDGTSHASTLTIQPKITINQNDTAARLSNGTYNMFAGLKKVSILYNHQTSGNFSPAPIVINAAAENLGNVDDNGGDARFMVDGTLTMNIVNNSTSTVHVRVRVKFQQGARYLKRTTTNASGNNNYSGLVWSTLSTDYIEMWSNQVGVGQTLNYSYLMRFETPYLVNDGDVILELDYANLTDCEDLFGNPVTSNVIVSGQLTSYIEYVTDSDAELEREFQADNSGLGNYSEVLTLPVTYFGDRINSSTTSGLEVYNSSSAWVSSNQWKKGNSGTARKLLELLCEEILSGQRSATKKYFGTIRGDIGFLNTVSFESEVFLFLSGSFNPQKMEWQNAELFKIAYDTSSITIDSNPLSTNGVTPSTSTNNGLGTFYDQSTTIDAQSVNAKDPNGNTNIGTGVIPGSNNINIGGGLSNGTGGEYNTAIGQQSGYSNTTGVYNTFIGRQSGYSNTTGVYNTFIGRQSGYSNTTGSYNAFIGLRAGYSNTTGSYNTFIGHQSGYSNTSGAYNTFIGLQSGYSNNSGVYNTFIGLQSGYSNTTGGYNNFIGRQSGYNNTTGFYNTFIGYIAGYNNTTGNYNTFIGRQSGYSNTTGSYNAFIGLQSGYSNTTSSYNTFIGYESGYSNTTGANNIFVGYESGYSNTTGANNILLGENTSTGNFSNCVVLGKGATATSSNQIVIGSSSTAIGSIVSESVTSDRTIVMIIDGVKLKILARAV